MLFRFSEVTLLENNEYDFDNPKFLGAIEHKDYVTGLQYTAKNIITYKVHNYTLNDGYSGGRQDLNNIGSGEGYFISEGYAIPITCPRPNVRMVATIRANRREQTRVCSPPNNTKYQSETTFPLT